MLVQADQAKSATWVLSLDGNPLSTQTVFLLTGTQTLTFVLTAPITVGQHQLQAQLST